VLLEEVQSQIPGEAMRSSQADRTHRRQKELGSITPPSL
jgi:hypothetical protein